MARTKSTPVTHQLCRAEGTALSIDFDFFVDNPAELPGIYRATHSIDTNAGPVPIANIFDYDHTEYAGSRLTNAIWQSRLANLLSLGLHPDDWLGLRAGALVSEFIRMFGNISSPLFSFADSHAMGRAALNTMVAEFGAPIAELFHFDAHHDLGYTDEAIQRDIEKDTSDAGSWLYHALRQNVVSHVSIVYPDWKGTYEADRIRELKHWPSIADRVTFYSWTSFVHLRLAHLHGLHGSFLCRSSAWVPPTKDKLFLELLNWLKSRFNPYGVKTAEINLDIKFSTGFDSVDVEREIDWESLHKLAEQYANIRKTNYVRPSARGFQSQPRRTREDDPKSRAVAELCSNKE